MDCSSYKILRELGLDPCKRGRIISSIFYFSILYYFCTQGSNYSSYIIYYYMMLLLLLIYVFKFLFFLNYFLYKVNIIII